jgi:ribosomal-protein-alanine N-acetyltransferase
VNASSDSRVPNIRTERCVVRLGALADVPGILDYWRANGQRYSPPLPLSFLKEEVWTEAVLKSHKTFFEDTEYRLYVFDRTEQGVIGTVSFHDIRRGPAEQSCSLGYAIAGSHEGRGYMYEALAPWNGRTTY